MEHGLTGLLLFSWRGPFRRCVIASEWNVEGGRLYIAGFFEHFLFLSSRSLKECWIDGLGHCSAGFVGMRVSLEMSCWDSKQLLTSV